jgi:hypothetical protein
MFLPMHFVLLVFQCGNLRVFAEHACWWAWDQLDRCWHGAWIKECCSATLGTKLHSEVNCSVWKINLI